MFGFQHIDHKLYRKNFLRKVIFQINFNEISLKNLEADLRIHFKDTFPRITNREGNGIQISFDNNQPNFQSLTESNGYILKNLSGKIVLEATSQSFILSFESNDDYVSFNNSIKYLQDAILFLQSKAGVAEITSYSSRKINIIEFENNSNPNGIVYFLLNNTLIGNTDCFPNMSSINHNFQSVNFAIKDYFLNLKYGMNIPPNINSKLGQVIIDIDLVRKENFPTSDFNSIAKNVNDEIFNVFNWIASDNLKNILSNG